MALRETRSEVEVPVSTGASKGGIRVGDPGGRRFALGGLRPAVVGMALLVCAAGAWMVLGGVGSDPMPAAIQQLIEDHRTAWENEDIAGLEATSTGNYLYSARMYATGRDIANPDRVTLIRDVEDDLEYWRFRFGQSSYSVTYGVEQVGDPIVSGDGPWFVSVEEVWSDPTISMRSAGVALYVVVEEQGELLIDKFDWAGLKGWEGLDG